MSPNTRPTPQRRVHVLQPASPKSGRKLPVDATVRMEYYRAMLGETRKQSSFRRAALRICWRAAGGLLSGSVATLLCLAAMSGTRAGAAEPASSKLPLRVIYFGQLQSGRGEDFVGFLESHFTKVGRGELGAFRPEAAKDYDVVIMDYGELTVTKNGIQTPPIPFGTGYSRATMMLGATGALVGGQMGLKTGYL